MVSSKLSWKGILSFNNFEYTKRGIRVWKAYNIGRGKLFTNAQLKKLGASQGPTNLTSKQPFSRPREATGALVKSKPAQDKEQTPVFNCPEETCVHVFSDSSSLQHHLDIGMHSTEPNRESAFDSIKRNWARRCLSVRPVQKDAPLGAETLAGGPGTASTPSCEQGWALKKKKKSTRFSKEVRQFLVDAFWEGQDTGRKHDPKVISTQLRSATASNGKKMFAKCEDWLTSQQIASFFSRLSTLNKAGKLRRGNADVQDDDEVDQLIEHIQMNDLIASIDRELQL